MSHHFFDLGVTCNTGSVHDLDIENPTLNVYFNTFVHLFVLTAVNALTAKTTITYIFISQTAAIRNMLFLYNSYCSLK